MVPILCLEMFSMRWMGKQTMFIIESLILTPKKTLFIIDQKPAPNFYQISFTWVICSILISFVFSLLMPNHVCISCALSFDLTYVSDKTCDFIFPSEWLEIYHFSFELLKSKQCACFFHCLFCDMNWNLFWEQLSLFVTYSKHSGYAMQVYGN